MDTNTYNSAFSMEKILHNLRYSSQDVSMKINTKRIFTPAVASKFVIPEARNQQITKTPYSNSPDSKSKVSKDFLLVNILQSASDNPVSGYKGEGPTDRYTPGEWLVTVTTAPWHPITQGQRTHLLLVGTS